MAKKRVLGKHFIREWREYRGYSLRKLALMMEQEPGEEFTSHSNLQRIETYQQPYSQDILEALAVALQVSVTDLLTVDPMKEGEVVDLVRLIDDKNRATAVRLLRAFIDTGTGGGPVLLPQDEDDAEPSGVGGPKLGETLPRVKP